MKTNRYRRQYLKWHQAYEKRTLRELQNVFRKWAYEFKPWGQPNQWAHQMESAFEEEDLVKAYTTVYVNLGVTHGGRIRKHIRVQKKDFGLDVFKEAYQRFIAIYLQQNLMATIFDVRQTFIKWLAEELVAQQQILGGAPDPARVATWLQQQARSRGFYRWQALRIARTEATAASNLGGLQAAKDSGFAMDKVWISATDPRTRRLSKGDYFDHLEMNGVQIPMSEKFKVPGKFGVDELEFPGDPKGHPANIINCRCTLVYRPPKGSED